MPPMLMQHDTDPKLALLDELGDLSDVQVFHNDVVVAVYLRPEKTKSGIYLPDQHRDEDRYQSKVGLVVKLGPDAFVDPTGEWFRGNEVKLGDWVWHKPSDGFAVTIGNTLCRVLKDTSIRGTTEQPDRIW